MTTKNTKIENILDKFSDINGKEGVLIISPDGLVIVSKLNPGYQEDKIAEKIAVIATTANELVRRKELDDLDQILVEGKNRKMLIHKNHRLGFFVILAGKETMNVGLTRLAIKEAMPELEQVFSSED